MRDVSISVYKNIWREILFLRTKDWLIWGFELVGVLQWRKECIHKEKMLKIISIFNEFGYVQDERT